MSSFVNIIKTAVVALFIISSSSCPLFILLFSLFLSLFPVQKWNSFVKMKRKQILLFSKSIGRKNILNCRNINLLQ